ncbi:ead/Ea22-like family protein [Enterobacter roggenkampii]|uniref:ead/Ea22-like family protein n=1 Tax=Enterobacter roggenkampii TaxID=1812935 RepID=UPI0007B373D9|nr:ead/Ea22-like family protein [Enterobacter roggenkampii]KZQ20274.1 hypothetical protein A3461_23715 [Enterobacter roggenkampii]
MSNIDKQSLRQTAEKAQEHGVFNMDIHSQTMLALLDELEAAENKTVEMPTFDGYVPNVARELQAAFRIACDNAGINIAAAGKGEAS